MPSLFADVQANKGAKMQSFHDTLREEAKRAVAVALGGDKLAYSIPEFCAAAGIGRTRVYDAISKRKLRAKKYGARTLILAEDGREFLANLPDLQAG